MGDEPLPVFRYYRDPIGDGTIVPSLSRCAACERKRDWIVTSTAYGADVPDGAEFCPWCVAEGRAHGRFGASFNEVDIGAAADATEQVSTRTPGFVTWQDWAWPTHCGDVGVYLGTPSGAELRSNADALGAFTSDIAQWDWGRDERYVEELINGLGGSTMVYLFLCPRCSQQLVRWDID